MQKNQEPGRGGHDGGAPCHDTIGTMALRSSSAIHHLPLSLLFMLWESKKEWLGFIMSLDWSCRADTSAKSCCSSKTRR